VVVGSATAPVEGVIRSGHNGLLVDFFSPTGLAEQVAAVLANPASHRPLGQQARRTVVERFDLNAICLPRQLALVDWLAAAGTAAAAPGPWPYLNVAGTSPP
jgi:hypothetical protein